MLLLWVVFSVNMTMNAQWVKLFEGEHLKAWKASENPETFNLTEGALTVHGPKAHLFYDGPLANHNFKDFELKVKQMVNTFISQKLDTCFRQHNQVYF